MQSGIAEMGTPDAFSLKRTVTLMYPKLNLSVQRLTPRGLIVFRIPLTPDADVNVVIHI